MNVLIDFVDIPISISKPYSEIIQKLGSNHKLDEYDGNTDDHYLNLAKTMHYRLKREYLIGLSNATSWNADVIAWYNTEPFHSTAISLNFANNAIIKGVLGANYSIDVTNKPFKFINEYEKGSIQLRDFTKVGFVLAIFMSFAMAFVSSFYIIFYIRERVSQVKLLQFVCGLSASTLWITSIIFDLIVYLFSTGLVMISIFAFQMNGWTTKDELLPLLVTLLVFGASMLPIIYVLSRLFALPSTGFIRVTIFFICTGELCSFFC